MKPAWTGDRVLQPIYYYINLVLVTLFTLGPRSTLPDADGRSVAVAEGPSSSHGGAPAFHQRPIMPHTEPSHVRCTILRIEYSLDPNEAEMAMKDKGNYYVGNGKGKDCDSYRRGSGQMRLKGGVGAWIKKASNWRR